MGGDALTAVLSRWKNKYRVDKLAPSSVFLGLARAAFDAGDADVKAAVAADKLALYGYTPPFMLGAGDPGGRATAAVAHFALKGDSQFPQTGDGQLHAVSTRCTAQARAQRASRFLPRSPSNTRTPFRRALLSHPPIRPRRSSPWPPFPPAATAAAACCSTR